MRAILLRRTRNDGFTLLELITVLFLLSLLSLLVVPGLLQTNSRWILRNSAYMLANDIRRVQSLAIQEGRTYQLELYTTQFYYNIRTATATDLPIKRIDFPPQINEITANFTDGMDGAYGLHFVRFRSTGSPSTAGTIILRTSSGAEKKLTVDVATGRVLVHD